MRMFLASFIHVLSYTLMYAKLCSIHFLYYLDNKFNYFIAFALIVSFAIACVSLCSCYNAFFQIYVRKVAVVEWEVVFFWALNFHVSRIYEMWKWQIMPFHVYCIFLMWWEDSSSDRMHWFIIELWRTYYWSFVRYFNIMRHLLRIEETPALSPTLTNIFAGCSK